MAALLLRYNNEMILLSVVSSRFFMRFNECIRQLLIHHKYLKDKETGLFCRGYSCITKDNKYEYLWKKAAEGVISRLDENGIVRGVSSCSPVMPTANGYKCIKIKPILYGQALTVLMLCEIDD